MEVYIEVFGGAFFRIFDMFLRFFKTLKFTSLCVVFLDIIQPQVMTMAILQRELRYALGMPDHHILTNYSET